MKGRATEKSSSKNCKAIPLDFLSGSNFSSFISNAKLSGNTTAL